MGVNRYAVMYLVLMALWLPPLRLAAQQGPSVPAWIFGTWILNTEKQMSDRQSDLYRCYVEVLDNLGDGKVRMRDYRIREDGQVVKNDATIQFGRVYDQPGGNILQWRISPNQSGYESILFPKERPIRDISRGFFVERDILEDGKVMRHVGQGSLPGMEGRSEYYFEKVTGPAKSGDCAVE